MVEKQDLFKIVQADDKWFFAFNPTLDFHQYVKLLGMISFAHSHLLDQLKGMRDDFYNEAEKDE